MVASKSSALHSTHTYMPEESKMRSGGHFSTLHWPHCTALHFTVLRFLQCHDHDKTIRHDVWRIKQILILTTKPMFCSNNVSKLCSWRRRAVISNIRVDRTILHAAALFLLQFWRTKIHLCSNCAHRSYLFNFNRQQGAPPNPPPTYSRVIFFKKKYIN